MNDAGEHRTPYGPSAEAVEQEEGTGAGIRPRIGTLASVGIGVGAALLGLLPWLVTGARLPLQNLWATGPPAEDMPIALLPLSQYATTLITGLLVTGAAIAGLVARLTPERRASRGVAPIAIGVLLVHVVAGVQSVRAVAGGLEDSARARFYLAALIAVVVVSAGIALVVLVLAARAPVPGATIGFSVGALAAGTWLGALAAPFGSMPSPGASHLLTLTYWIPPTLVGLAIAWAGFGTAGRIAGDLVALLALWIGSAAITAVSAAAGTRVLAPYPLEMLDYGIGVFLMRVGMPELVLPPLVVSVVVGAAGVLALRALRERRGGATPDPAGPASPAS